MDTMRAWQWNNIDDKLETSLSLNENVTKPRKEDLRHDQLLVQVFTAALNPVDYKLPESGWIGGLMIRGRPATPGLDFCGHVVAAHESITTLREGDSVFGAFASANQFGSLAEFIVISTQECTRLPDGVEIDQAAAVGCAGTTAFQSVPTDLLKEPEVKMLINGGSGGVGTFAIQFAKAQSAEVVTTCSAANVQLCRDLGADRVIDYTADNVTATLAREGCTFDLIIDNVGDPNFYDKSISLLRKGGTFMQVGVPSLNATNVLKSFGRMILPGSYTYRFIQMKNSSMFFSQIGQWMAEGKVRAVIGEQFDFEQVPQAYAKLRTGRAKGKIIIHVAKRQ
ncbi:zinc ion binding [Neopestalotiopsis sp. 37M]|nr:zinc ion binding [Neopestalotiopsis sp. 37M]